MAKITIPSYILFLFIRYSFQDKCDSNNKIFEQETINKISLSSEEEEDVIVEDEQLQVNNDNSSDLILNLRNFLRMRANFNLLNDGTFFFHCFSSFSKKLTEI